MRSRSEHVHVAVHVNVHADVHAHAYVHVFTGLSNRSAH
jgi:hypothetical protein